MTCRTDIPRVTTRRAFPRGHSGYLSENRWLISLFNSNKEFQLKSRHDEFGSRSE